MAEKYLCQDALFCGICQREYTLPRMMDCFHMFCTPCIERLIKGKSTFSCPTCSEICSVHADGIDSFDLYPFYEFKNEECESGRSYTCQMCDEKSVYSKCVDCDQNMCTDCHRYHLKHKILRNHKVQTIEKIANTVVKKQEKICKKHNLQYSQYCMSCNMTMCKVCAELKHRNHKILDVNGSAVTMKHYFNLGLSGLKPKMSYVIHFLDNCKTEQQKYNTHIKQAEAEMKSSASNLKDALCSAIDLFLSQNIAALDSESKMDKQILQSYIDKTESEAKFLINLVKFTEETLRCAEGYEITKLASSLCRQINHCETTCFQSKLTLFIQKFKAGDVSLKPIREFVGTVGRDDKTELSLRLNIPSNELLIYPTFGNIKKAKTLQIDTSINQTVLTGFACFGSYIYLSQVETHNCIYNNQNITISKGVIECKDIDGETKFRKDIENFKSRNSQFQIIGIHSQTIYLLVDNYLKTVEIKYNANIIDISESTQLKLEISDINLKTCCLTDNENILVFEPQMEAFFEFRKNGTLEKRISISTVLKDKTVSNVAILKTLSNCILLSSRSEIFSFDILGDLKNHFHFDGAAVFSDMCTDRHGNVFVADKQRECVCLFTSDGYFVRDLNQPELNPLFRFMEAYRVCLPRLTVDPCGNLLQLFHNNISVYSYL